MYISYIYKSYRIANCLYKRNIPLFPKFIKLFNRVVFSCYIPYSSQIGICNFGKQGLGVVIHEEAVIGDYCVIGHNVTIGGSSEKTNGKVPRIGRYVRVGSGACILGDVIVGDRSIIASNSVVILDVPPNSLIAGNPAKVIKENINITEYIDFAKYFKLTEGELRELGEKT